MSFNEESASIKKIPLKVLIADDDPPTRVMLRTAIAQWDYEAVEANDGEEAWNLLKDQQGPKLLILDWLMPKMDGLQLCKLIREKLLYHSYIILLTQNTGTANIVMGLDAGADEFLTKPFKMTELRSRLAVGARIIGYENMLAQEMTKKESYMQEAKKIQLLTDNSLNELERLTQQLSTTPLDAAKCQEKVTQIMDDIKSIKNISTTIQNTKIK